MVIKKQFKNIKVQEFEEQYRQALYDFKLSERQQIYSSLPKDVLDDALTDEDRIANIVLNEEDQVVGFFVLHQFYQHEGYDTPEQVVYIRSLSINEVFQGNGYGTQIMMFIPQYVQTVFPDFNHLYLVVDAENKGAWNLYERAGFMHTATKEEGPIGKERLYYLDLDAKYVSSLSLILNDEEYKYGINIIDLIKDGSKVGFIAVEQHDNRLNITSIEVDASERLSGIAQSALRQLSTFVRKNFEGINVITITLYGERNELKPLCLNSNFVAFEEGDDFVIFEKYINY
ncbi:GNAT family N-acetyltransferase [Staphylococcus kloosii]|jgi:RimJ/RimL family protein N-acetyltransferase|uniref:N-acetyltransferase n=1 Tax=Staphylococcus kloosii TaxID=29384 RepID=A0ABQ0XLR0_9STAP|nr:GNAT family N-acetyltransferase [Staphylococcus kloosii]AVQ35599.1 N-acetyltransferase [Staphylococcus kloosii]PNZ04912.1 GNAT family N-acetyltransferase [Staphylococcus kloosii]GEP82373.1 N-acetyltransferase [Staphylococcus kloosii]SUM48653.1 acetyltransferase [Staphylococcus kloosii]